MQLEFFTGQYCKDKSYGYFLDLVYYSASHTLKVPALKSFGRLESSMRTKTFETSYKLKRALSFKYYQFFSFTDTKLRLAFYGANFGAVSYLNINNHASGQKEIKTYNKYSVFYNIIDSRAQATMQEDFSKLYRHLRRTGQLLNVHSALERLKLATG